MRRRDVVKVAEKSKYPPPACPPYKSKGVRWQDVIGVTGYYKGPLLKGGSLWPEDLADYYRDKETRFDR
jgi:hypothetical protein